MYNNNQDNQNIWVAISDVLDKATPQQRRDLVMAFHGPDYKPTEAEEKWIKGNSKDPETYYQPELVFGE